MRYLVDANVLCEPTQAAPNSRVLEWLRQNEREIAIDPIILGEIRFGILLLTRGRRRPASSNGSGRGFSVCTACRGRRKRVCAGPLWWLACAPPAAPCPLRTVSLLPPPSFMG